MRRLILTAAIFFSTVAPHAMAQDTVWWMPNFNTSNCGTSADAAIQFHVPAAASPDLLVKLPGYIGTKTTKYPDGSINFEIVELKMPDGKNLQLIYFGTLEGCNQFMQAVEKGRANLQRQHGIQ